MAVELARLGPEYRISGLDISHSFVRLAAEHARRAGVSMQLSPPSAFVTRWIFRLGLLRAAHTRWALEAVVGRRRFGRGEIVLDGIGFELRLVKETEPVTSR